VLLPACSGNEFLFGDTSPQLGKPQQEGVTPTSHTHPPHAAHVGHTAAVTARLLLDQLGNHSVGG
jgi:hypothetical protein